MDKATLRECPNPWCGGSAQIVNVHGNGLKRYFVRCRGCGATPIGMKDTEAEAIAAWNTRPSGEGAAEARGDCVDSGICRIYTAFDLRSCAPAYP